MIIVEIKTRLDDIGDVERQISWYERNAFSVARSIGWRPKRSLSWLLLLASEEVETQLSLHRRVLRQAFPDRAPAMRELLSDGGGQASRRGLALVDPTSRRQHWLISARSDGRRSATPFWDYAEAARRFTRASP